MSASSDLKTANTKLNSLGGNFAYSDKGGLQKAYNNAYNDYNNWVNNASAHGYDAYISDVNSLFGQIMNQDKFSYDPQKDELFQMYKKQYNAAGNRAMRNTMGVATARSGGYNSSAAQTAAQSTFQGYMDELSNKAAETYQNALDMYKYNQQNLLNRYNTARDMNNAGNEAYWKQVDVRANKLNNAYNAYNNERNFQYNSWSDNRNYWQNRQQAAQSQINWAKEYELNKKNYYGK